MIGRVDEDMIQGISIEGPLVPDGGDKDNRARVIQGTRVTFRVPIKNTGSIPINFFYWFRVHDSSRIGGWWPGDLIREWDSQELFGQGDFVGVGQTNTLIFSFHDAFKAGWRDVLMNVYASRDHSDELDGDEWQDSYLVVDPEEVTSINIVELDVS